MPRQRYFPTDADVDRWLRSSPVEVDGAEIGRINARLLDDGRIEFAFTPTDGERIAPQARYFPADARVGRWLRSTEIAISTPEDATLRYIAVSAGSNHTCAIRSSGEIACWGANADGQSDAPTTGSFAAISTGETYSCAIRDTREIECWGATGDRDAAKRGGLIFRPGEFLTDAPDGEFTAVSAVSQVSCGLRSTGAIECWGYDDHVRSAAPTGSFTAISVGTGHACAISENDGAIECWGANGNGQTDAPPGNFRAVAAGWNHSCAIRASDGAIECWGNNEHYAYDDTGEVQRIETGQTDAPDGSFRAVSAGRWHTCGLRESGAIDCWGASGSGQTDAPDGSYAALSAGTLHNCAIRERDSAIVCWGDDEHGQATSPTN